jgi:hypothetical protein
VSEEPVMTQRDYLAGEALANPVCAIGFEMPSGLCGTACVGSPAHKVAVREYNKQIARRAYQIADAMLEVRND